MVISVSLHNVYVYSGFHRKAIWCFRHGTPWLYQHPGTSWRSASPNAVSRWSYLVYQEISKWRNSTSKFLFVGKAFLTLFLTESTVFSYRNGGRERGEKTLQWFTNYFQEICFETSEIHLREFKQAFENKSVSPYGTKNWINVNEMFYNLFLAVFAKCFIIFLCYFSLQKKYSPSWIETPTVLSISTNLLEA